MDKKQRYITSWLKTDAGKVPIVSNELDIHDNWDTFLVRLSFNRSDYKVDPGIYAVGNPTPDSVVLVSANYKLSFDTLRKNIKGLDAWILVLDTKGINVWCAAGKGTFGTAELVNRISLVQLDKIVNHKKLIVPQLGATGIAAHEVKKLSGFSVIYGPVRVSDISAFMNAGMKATPEMRLVRFAFYDRLVLTPVEIIIGGKYLIYLIAVFFLLSGINSNGYSTNLALVVGLRAARNLVLGLVAGAFLGPLLLPWLPGRSFSFKGFFTGIILILLLSFRDFAGNDLLEVIAWMLIIPAISSFLTMNFTGSSTYTSLSGVRKEMRRAVPLQISASALGIILWLTDRFV